MRTCVFIECLLVCLSLLTQVGPAVTQNPSPRLSPRTCLRHTRSNALPRIKKGTACTRSWTEVLRFTCVLVCFVACVLVFYLRSYFREIQIYLRMWNEKGKSELHENRVKLLTEAVLVVQTHQVMPLRSGPFSGDLDLAVMTILPLLEEALLMPRNKARVGSKAWLSERIKNPDLITFQDCIEFPDVENALIAHLINIGVAEGAHDNS